MSIKARISILAALMVALGAVAFALPPLEAGAADRLAKSPRHGEWVTINAAGGDKVDAYIVYPERSDKAPVVIVVHEIFGLSDWVRSVADQLAADGFIAVAPDFLSGKGPDGKGSRAMTVEQARPINSALKMDEVVARLNAVADYATALPAANKQFGIVGYCWGGGVSFAYATAQPKLGASVVYYGVSPAKEALANVKAPVLGLYGGDDARVNATVGPAQEEMKRLGKTYEVEMYAGAGHGFLRQQDGREGANLKATQQAWPRTVEFFKKHLSAGMSMEIEQIPLVASKAAADDDCGDDCALPAN